MNSRIGDGSVVERRTRDRRFAGSSPGRSGGRIFLSRVNFMCRLSFPYPFHPCVTAVARKRSRSFFQRCRLQLNTHESYVCGFCVKWHCKLVHGVHRSLTWRQPCNKQNSAVSTPFRWIFIMRYVKGVIKNHIRQELSEYARERRITLYKKATNVTDCLSCTGNQLLIRLFQLHGWGSYPQGHQFCIVCNHRPANIIIFNCHHAVVCHVCVDGSPLCPFCRLPIEFFFRFDEEAGR